MVEDITKTMEKREEKRKMNITNKLKETNCIIKLTKMYIFFNPGCTSKEIATFLITQYNFKTNISNRTIGTLIKNYNDNKQYEWFQIICKKDKKNKRRYYALLTKNKE